MSTPATVKTHREPLLHTVKHAERSSRQTVALRLAAVALSLVAGGIFILAIGQNPFAVYATIVKGAFRSPLAIQATIKYTIPLCICALGVTLAFKMRFWNIGGEGQFIVGAIVAAVVAFKAGAVLPGAVTLLLMCLAAMAPSAAACGACCPRCSRAAGTPTRPCSP